MKTFDKILIVLVIVLVSIVVVSINRTRQLAKQYELLKVSVQSPAVIKEPSVVYRVKEKVVNLSDEDAEKIRQGYIKTINELQNTISEKETEIEFRGREIKMPHIPTIQEPTQKQYLAGLQYFNNDDLMLTGGYKIMPKPDISLAISPAFNLSKRDFKIGGGLFLRW